MLMKFSNLMNNLKLDTPSKFKVGQNLRLEIHVQKAIPFSILDEFQQMRAQNFQGGGNFLMLGIRVCATDQGRFFTSKNPEQAPNFEVLLQNRPHFLEFYSRTGSFFDNLVSNAPAQMLKNLSCFQSDRSSPNLCL